ncbi:MAG: DsbE family thiol:disulfide interchange protein [Lautropia sp.]|nr:DsbE family thiol:disulfide interchange protein [Lautropia sp.]
MPKPASRPALRFLIPALLFIGLAVFLLRGLDRNPQEIPSPLIGKPAPAWRMMRLTDVPPTLGQKAPTLPPAGADGGNTVSSTGQAPANAAAGAPTPSPAHTVATAQGAPAQLDASQLKGEPYILNIWASWCMPCLEEHPQFLKLAEQHPIRVVGLNYKDKPDDARRWLRRNGNPFDDIVQDERGRTAIDFGVYGVPETFLIDGAGNIRFKHVGAVTRDVLTKRLLPAIESLKTSR